jgi:hypothetical protein
MRFKKVEHLMSICCGYAGDANTFVGFAKNAIDIVNCRMKSVDMQVIPLKRVSFQKYQLLFSQTAKSRPKTLAPSTYFENRNFFFAIIVQSNFDKREIEKHA